MVSYADTTNSSIFISNEIVITTKDFVNAAKELYDNGEISYEEYQNVYIASTFRASSGVSKIVKTSKGYDIYISGIVTDSLTSAVSEIAAEKILDKVLSNKVGSFLLTISKEIVKRLLAMIVPDEYKEKGVIISFEFEEFTYYIDYFTKVNDIVLMYKGMRSQ